MIVSSESLFVIDSTKIDDYMSCPRQFLFRHVLGWQPDLPNIHLEFGIATHMAMEYLLHHGYSSDAAFEAYDVFLTGFARYMGVLGDTHPKKNCANAMYMLQRYAQVYSRDLNHFELLNTEVAGVVALDFEGNRKLYFRSDAICKGMILDQTGYFSLEHKTGTSPNRQWMEQWTQKTQMGAYAWMLNCLFPHEQVLGVVVNGLFPNSPPQLKKDGTPYANASDVEFQRVLIRKTEQQLMAWQDNVIAWYDELHKDLAIALEVQETPDILPCFKKRTEECSSYSGCPYANYCYAWANPIRRAEPQPGFHYELWDPRRLLEEAKQVVQ